MVWVMTRLGSNGKITVHSAYEHLPVMCEVYGVCQTYTVDFVFDI